MQPIIKWSGSKRSQMMQILSHFPTNIETYYEPFVGGGSVLYGVLKNKLCQKAIASDLCEPLIDMWNAIKENSDALLYDYTDKWNKLQVEGIQVYYNVRERFNGTHNPEDFFFLNRTCFNGLMRFTKDGKFNTAFHLNRKGIEPKKLKEIIKDWCKLFDSYAPFLEFKNCDYAESISKATEKDFVYLDPPYANTKGMYLGNFDARRLFENLETLNNKNIKWLLSYDGNRFPDTMIPESLYKNHYLLDSGVSSFSRIKSKDRVWIKESLYANF